VSEVRRGRWAARIDGDFVVFPIGARIDLGHPVRTFKDLGGMRGMPYETFLVRAGECETVYGNMPPHGLARAAGLVPLREDSTARGRLKRLAS